MTTAHSGRRCIDLYARHSQLGFLVRTLLGSSVWNSTICFLTWETRATQRKSLIFRCVPSMPDIDDIACGLLPTVTTDSAKNRTKKYSQRGTPLPLALMPTLQASDAGAGSREPDGKRGANLKDMTGKHAEKWAQLLPTADANSWKGGVRGNGTGKPLQLSNAHPGICEEGQPRGPLNPTWLEWFMGFPEGWTELED